MGFNVCMIGRNEVKMQKALQEIKDKNPKIKTMYIVFDFNKYFTINDYQTIIGEKLSGIDVAMLFLNAGWASAGSFAKSTPESIEQ